MPELKLLCEYSISPIDIQTQLPRFSWLLDDSSIPEQLSYRITVACDQAFKQLVWDSGTVQSRASLGIVYGGAPLKDCSEYYWKVHILCRGGFSFSGASSFETAISPGAKWQGEWISHP